MRTYTLLVALLLGACHDSDDDGGNGPGAPDFDALVTDLIQNQTSDTGTPVEVNGQVFAFPTDANAFDDVLPPDDGPVVEQ